MSWNTLPPTIRHTAEQHLTPKQLDTWKLQLAGLGTRAIANALNISRSSVTDRLHHAHHTLRQHGIRQDANGNWYHHPPQETTPQ